MDDETMQTLETLETVGAQLKARAQALSRPGEDQDTAMLMAALAVTMESVRSIGENVNQLNGLRGLAGSGR